MTTRLFAILVGGKHERATIELHDVQFVAAASIEDTVPILRQRWWGIPTSLHIDAYAEIDTLDGYKIEPAPKAQVERAGVSLYFVNTGGYKDSVFGEEHSYSFHVGADRSAIWSAARERAQFDRRHQDNFDPIDDIVCVDDALGVQSYGLRYGSATGAADVINISAAYMKLSS